MKIGSKILILFLAICQNGWAQSFTNLNFEDTSITPANPPGTVTFYATSVAIPGWAAYLGEVGQSIIPNDGISTGGAVVSLQDTNAISPYAAIQGNYSVLLQGPSTTSGSDPTTASIGQTGTIPNTAQSLTFYLGNLYGTFQVSFNGQTLSFMDISNTLNYTIWGANISAYAGQTGQLLFSAPIHSGAVLDDIQFSSLPVPEPAEFALAVLGALILGFHYRRSHPC